MDVKETMKEETKIEETETKKTTEARKKKSRLFKNTRLYTIINVLSSLPCEGIKKLSLSTGYGDGNLRTYLLDGMEKENLITMERVTTGNGLYLPTKIAITAKGQMLLETLTGCNGGGGQDAMVDKSDHSAFISENKPNLPTSAQTTIENENKEKEVNMGNGIDLNRKIEEIQRDTMERIAKLKSEYENREKSSAAKELRKVLIEAIDDAINRYFGLNGHEAPQHEKPIETVTIKYDMGRGKRLREKIEKNTNDTIPWLSTTEVSELIGEHVKTTDLKALHRRGILDKRIATTEERRKAQDTGSRLSPNRKCWVWKLA